MHCFTNVFSDVIFYPSRTAIVLGIRKLSQRLHVMIWHCCHRTKAFEVCGPRIYQTESKINHRLYIRVNTLNFDLLFTPMLLGVADNAYLVALK